MVARGLFASKRARADIQPTIAFLCTRASNPDEDDWKKLVRLMSYLKRTKCLAPTSSAKSMTTLQWHVDASHAMHPDGKGHAGGTLTLGEGVACNQSAKQKLNARSSAESELAGADDLMPQILWTNCFLKAQGHTSTATMLNQENKSAVLL